MATEELTFTLPNDLKELKHEYDLAAKNKDFPVVFECTKRLAELGDTEMMREYGKMLLHDNPFPKNPDLASAFFIRAAMNRDGESAFCAAKLFAEKAKKEPAHFWYLMAAVLGFVPAYSEAANCLFEDKLPVLATYFLREALRGGNAEAIYNLASRYYDGRGVVKSDPYAKWALKQMPKKKPLKISVASSVLMLRLRDCNPAEPPMPSNEDLARLERRLCEEAKVREYMTLYRSMQERLAERGNASSVMDYSTTLAEGVGGEADPNAAASLLLDAGRNGSDEALLALADQLFEGTYLAQNTDQAISALTLVAERGNGTACRRLGDLYAEGKAVPESVETAIYWYECGASAGDKDCFERGQRLDNRRASLHEEGKNLLLTDADSAFRSFALSASMGYLPARLSLGKCYEQGIGAKKNRAHAFSLYREVVDAGFEEASYDLGRAYARGIGTAFCFREAVKYLGRADRLGDPRAKAELDRLYENKRKHMTRSLFSGGIRLLYRRKWEEAAIRISSAAAFGSLEAKYILGCLYEFGVGVKLDRERAHDLYAEVQHLGYSDPGSQDKLRILKLLR